MTTPSGDRPSVVVGRIGRPHGVRGDVSVEVRTDEPDRRFAEGTRLRTDRPEPGTVTVTSHRWHSGRLLVHFEGIDDRDRAESLRGLLLHVELDPGERPDDPDEFYDHQLVGLRAVRASGDELGVVVQVVHGAQDLLVIRLTPGGEAMVPFVRALVPEVDLAAGRVVVDPPEGLLELGVT